MASCALLAGIVGGCATSGDLEELGAELKKNQESLKQELQQSQKAVSYTHLTLPTTG